MRTFNAAASKKKLRISSALQPWLWCGIVTSLILAVYLGEVVRLLRIPAPTGFVDFNMTRVDQYLDVAHRREKSKNVVLFGTSRMKYATDLNLDVPQPEQASPLDQFNTLRLVKNVAVFEDFRPFLDYILASAPDVVVIEIELLAVNRTPGFTHLSNVREYLKWLAFGVGQWRPDNKREKSIQYDKPCSRESKEEFNALRRANKGIYQLDSDPNPKYSSLVEWFATTAATRGARVIFLDLPITLAMDTIISPARDRAITVMHDKFGRFPTVTAMRYPVRFDEERFCDSRHLNAAARAQFTNWLGERIQNN